MTKKQFSIRIDEILLQKLRIIAKHEIRSVNQQIIIFIKSGLKSYEEK